MLEGLKKMKSGIIQRLMTNRIAQIHHIINTLEFFLARIHMKLCHFLFAGCQAAILSFTSPSMWRLHGISVGTDWLMAHHYIGRTNSINHQKRKKRKANRVKEWWAAETRWTWLAFKEESDTWLNLTDGVIYWSLVTPKSRV